MVKLAEAAAVCAWATLGRATHEAATGASPIAVDASSWHSPARRRNKGEMNAKAMA